MPNQIDTTLVRNIAIGLLAGLILGWLFGAFVAPPRFVNAGPQHLADRELATYVESVVLAASVQGGDPAIRQAFCRWDNVGVELQTRRDRLSAEYAPYLDDFDRAIAVLQADSTCPAAAGAEQPAADAGSGFNVGRLTAILGVLLLLLVAAGGILYVLSQRQGATRVQRTRPSSLPQESARSAPDPAAPGGTTIQRTTEPDITPLAGFQTTYLRGDEDFDKSFIIENATSDFLGECGVSVSETINTEDGRFVTAFEVWLFDKTDTRTVTKVLMSEYAYNDDGLRAKLAPRGEPVLARVGETVALETASLIINASITELAYSSDAPYPNGGFERFTAQLAAWVKSDDNPAPETPSTESRADDILEF